MSSRLVRPVRRAVLRFVVLTLVLAGAAPLDDLLSGGSSDGYAAATRSASADSDVEMQTLDVPEEAAGPTPAPEPGAEAEPRVVAELSDPRTMDFGTVGVTWLMRTAPADLAVELRTRTEGEWTPWAPMDLIGLDDRNAERSGTDPVWVGESNGIEVRLLSSVGTPEDPQVVLIDGGTGLAGQEPEEELALASSETSPATTAEVTTAEVATAEVTTEPAPTEPTPTEPTPTEPAPTEPTPTPPPAEPVTTSTGVAPMPSIVTRAQWGVDERSQTSCSSPTTSTVLKGITLHHTAGANGYSQAEAPGIVRGIHSYHTRSLGWCDIGYNFLVDAYGTIYEGRRGGIAKQVRGAHAGNWDANMYTTGISMMGNFETVDVPTATRNAVVKLMAWRLSSFKLGAYGTYEIGGVKLPRIAGHRDIYSAGVRPATATACPGRYGYAWLQGSLRGQVQAAIDAAKTTPAPAPAPAPTPTNESYWVPADRKLVVRGRGYGHGRGMSQNGAQGAALQGLDHRRIAEFYYPGTSWGTVTGLLRVLISADTTDDVVVEPAAGLRIKDLVGGSVRELPARRAIRRWRLVPRDGRTIVQFNDGAWRRWKAPWTQNLTGEAEFQADVPITLVTPSGTRRYRGALRSAKPAPSSPARDTVNVVTVDQYVMGVLPAEMPTSWHVEALKAQAVAARTYATWSREQRQNRYYQVCDTTACQVYGGASAERARGNRAVRQTRTQILTYDAKPAFTQFSASNGGWTAAGSEPYLRAQQDPYDGWSGNTVHTWSQSVYATSLERAWPAVGRLMHVDVVGRDGNGSWSGRTTQLVLKGTQGQVTVTGDGFRFALGLRSTLLTVQPTPIMRRWARLGGSASALGNPRNTEVAVASGTMQRFDAGRIYHSRATGARELFGRVLGTYVKAGGPNSALGFPTTPVRAVGDSLYARFAGGGIYFHRPAAPVVVTGAIHRRFDAVGGLDKLGWPLTSNYRVRGGERVDFERASIVWNRSTRRTRIYWK